MGSFVHPELCLVGPYWKAPDVSPPSAGFQEQFVSQVFNWFRNLHWFSGCSAGDPCDISWVELFCFGSLTVAVCLRSRSMASGCVWVSTRMPYVVSLRRTRFFVRGVGLCLFVLRSCDLVPGAAVSSCSSGGCPRGSICVVWPIVAPLGAVGCQARL